MSATDRNKVVDEIRTTEETYLAQITFLETFIEDIRKKAEADPQSIEGRFANSNEGKAFLAKIRPLTVITGVSKSLFKALPELTISSPGGSAENPDLDQLNTALVAHAPYFKSYNEYMTSYDEISHMYATLKQKNKDFQKLVAKFDNDPNRPAKNTFESYLILPAQRLPRYILLLKELQKQESALNGADSGKKLDTSIKQIGTVTSSLNTFMKTQDTLTHWMTVLSKGDSKANLKLRTITRDGNLSAFATNADLTVLQMHLNNQLNKFEPQPAFIRVKYLTKKPLVIVAETTTKPQLTLYKITQKDGQHFDIEIQKDLRKLKTESGKIINYKYNEIEQEFVKANAVGEAVGEAMKTILAAKETAKAPTATKSTVVVPPPAPAIVSPTMVVAENVPPAAPTVEPKAESPVVAATASAVVVSSPAPAPTVAPTTSDKQKPAEGLSTQKIIAAQRQLLKKTKMEKPEEQTPPPELMEFQRKVQEREKRIAAARDAAQSGQPKKDDSSPKKT